VPFAEQLKVHPQRHRRELTPRPLALRAPGRLRPHLRRHAFQQLGSSPALRRFSSACRPRSRRSSSARSSCLAFSLAGGCPGGYCRCRQSLPRAARCRRPACGPRGTAVLAGSAAPARIGGRQVRDVAQARMPHVTKPSCWPLRGFHDRLMGGAGRVAADAAAGSLWASLHARRCHGEPCQPLAMRPARKSPPLVARII
jgi:hypothetical protein